MDLKWLNLHIVTNTRGIKVRNDTFGQITSLNSYRVLISSVPAVLLAGSVGEPQVAF